MKSLNRRKVFLIVLAICIIFRTLNFTYQNSLKKISHGRSPLRISAEYDNNNSTIIFQKLQLGFENDLNSNSNGMLSILVAWKLMLASLFVLKILIIDKRKRIITLITRYFQGGEYKEPFCFLK